MPPIYRVSFSANDEPEETPLTLGQQIRRCIIAALLGALFMCTVGRELWPIEKNSPEQHIPR